jgi:signal transduction histidine kinase
MAMLRLTSEQERQVTIIRNSMESLTILVNDMLDLAKIEAGQTELRPSEFTIGELLAGLRGMFRPLVRDGAVTLDFDHTHDAMRLHTDEQRLSQVLRNLVSNAVKFTERGEIHVAVAPDGRDGVRFDVRDTGIGIAPEQHERIFQDYTQVDGPIQRRVRGTGLGLPLARKLATLLGGRLELVSAPGVGSTFSVIVPRNISGDRHDA